jgi:hypothetical protein
MTNPLCRSGLAALAVGLGAGAAVGGGTPGPGPVREVRLEANRFSPEIVEARAGDSAGALVPPG